MVFHTTFNNISAKSWWSVLLVVQTEIPGEKPQTCRNLYLTLWKFSFEIKVSGLCDTSYLIQDVVSPHCGDEWSLSENYFMPSWRWNTWFNRLLYQEFSHIPISKDIVLIFPAIHKSFSIFLIKNGSRTIT
jgi:hypothetical protein